MFNRISTVFSTDRNRWLLFSLGLYLVLLPLFAGVYTGLFQADAENFLFNSDINQSHVAHAVNQLEGEEREATQHLAWVGSISDAEDFPAVVIRKWESSVGSSATETEDYSEARIAVRGTTYTVTFHSSVFSGAEVSIADANGTYLHTIEFLQDYNRPETAEQVRATLRNAKVDFARQVHDISGQRVMVGKRPQEAWSFFDFLYFSTLTQTTVGYGDILPNSTTTRMVVMVQVLLAVAIFVVIVNITLTKKRYRAAR